MNTVTPRFSDYLKLYVWLQRYNIGRWGASVILPIVIGTSIWRIMHEDLEGIDIGITLLTIGLVSILFFAWPYAILRDSERAYRQSKPFCFDFSDEGFTIKTDEVASEVKWSVVTKVRETNSALYLWTSQNLWEPLGNIILLPKRDIADLQAMQEAIRNRKASNKAL